LDIAFWAISAMEEPPSLTEVINEPKSCTPPMNIVPNTTQNIAGNQPHKITAITGPIIGPAPAIEAKWCPNRTSQFFAGI
jgi:hypothetical protein